MKSNNLFPSNKQIITARDILSVWVFKSDLEFLLIEEVYANLFLSISLTVENKI